MSIDTSLDEEIKDYLPQLNLMQKEAVLKLVKAFAADSDERRRVENEYISTMEHRFAEIGGIQDKGSANNK